MMYFIFKLYIAGVSFRSEQVTSSLRAMLEERASGDYSLDVVNVLEQPELAELDNVLATPTLIREAPQPRRRIIGDLSDLKSLTTILGLDAAPRGKAQE